MSEDAKMMMEQLEELRKEMGALKTCIENVEQGQKELNCKMDIIGYGQRDLTRRWDETVEFKKDKTQILLNLMDLNIDMRKVKEMLDIGEYQY